MSTIQEQANEMAAMARKLHRQPISKRTVDAAVQSTKPAAVLNTHPKEILEDGPLGGVVSALKSGAEAGARVGKSVAHGEVPDCGDVPMDDDDPEEEFIEEELVPGIHAEVGKVEAGDDHPVDAADAWSPEARLAAAEARKGKSKFQNPTSVPSGVPKSDAGAALKRLARAK